MKMTFRNKVAVVTGAASGIGRSLAVRLAAAGARLAICDVDAERLNDTASLCHAIGEPPLIATVNVADRAAMEAFAADVMRSYARVDYVFNNAGVGLAGALEHLADQDFELVMDVDFWGVYNGTRVFLPSLIQAEAGHIVNISSILGLFAIPSLSAYCTAKFAVRGFTESLRQEMIVSGHRVKVTCVHPGFVKTDIARNAVDVNGIVTPSHLALFDRLALTDSDRAAQTILKGTVRGKPRILVGLDARVSDIGIRTLGAAYQRPLAAVIGKLVPEWFSPKT